MIITITNIMIVMMIIIIILIIMIMMMVIIIVKVGISFQLISGRWLVTAVNWDSSQFESAGRVSTLHCRVQCFLELEIAICHFISSINTVMVTIRWLVSDAINWTPQQ